MLPEQIWDAADLPGKELLFGRPTGSAMPLMWAHAEYVKLLRSVRDAVVFDRIAAVADRYLSGRGRKDLEVWKLGRQARSVPAGATLRIQDGAAFRLRWSLDDWGGFTDSDSRTTALGIHCVDIVVPEGQRAAVRFTFFWPGGAGRWEGRDFRVEVEENPRDRERRPSG
jgi:glucoamylase